MKADGGVGSLAERARQDARRDNELAIAETRDERAGRERGRRAVSQIAGIEEGIGQHPIPTLCGHARCIPVSPKSKEASRPVAPHETAVFRTLQQRPDANYQASLGWTAQITLEEGLRRTVDWYHEHVEHLRG